MLENLRAASATRNNSKIIAGGPVHNPAEKDRRSGLKEPAFRK